MLKTVTLTISLMSILAGCAGDAPEPVVVEGHEKTLSWGVGNGRTEQATTASWGVGNGRMEQGTTASWGVGNGRTENPLAHWGVGNGRTDELVVLDPEGHDVPGILTLDEARPRVAFELDGALSTPGTYEIAELASGESLATFALAKRQIEQANELGELTIAITAAP